MLTITKFFRCEILDVLNIPDYLLVESTNNIKPMPSFSAASPVPPQATSSPAETSSPNSRRPPFYKMALCRNWLNNVAGCPFGDRCNFAHGRDQLRAQVLPCERGADCPDKQLCQYSHPEQKVRQICQEDCWQNILSDV